MDIRLPTPVSLTPSNTLIVVNMHDKPDYPFTDALREREREFTDALREL